MFILENDYLKAEIHPHGAELKSLVRKDTGISYLWYGDPKFWGRTSPVLFPFVGSLNEKTYRADGKAYPMGQHGFARDMDFEMISSSETDIWFELSSCPETLQKYPYAFILQIGYRLEEKSIRVLWKVINPSEEEMNFSIGAHPAFMCPLDEAKDPYSCQITFYDKEGAPAKKIVSTAIAEGGLVGEERIPYELEGGILPRTKHLFDHDALVLEHDQTSVIGLADEKGAEYVRVSFDAPLVGVWSPVGKDAPFVCIEPWYGRCDSAGFNGDIRERDWNNTLEGKGSFEASYRIETI